MVEIGIRDSEEILFIGEHYIVNFQASLVLFRYRKIYPLKSLSFWYVLHGIMMVNFTVWILLVLKELGENLNLIEMFV